MKEIDLAIPLGPTIDNYEELRYVLRSAEKHLKGLRNVYVYGKCPNWVKDVNHVPCLVKHKRKNHDIIHKLLLAGMSEKHDDAFMWCSDDQMFLSACDPEKYTTARDGQLLDQLGDRRTFWDKCHVATSRALISAGYHEAYYYDVHVPHVVEKSTILATFSRIPWREEPGWCIWSLLYNIAASEDVIYAQHLKSTTLEIKVKATFEFPPESQNAVEEACSSKNFLGLHDGAFNEHMRAFLEAKFPDKSRWEK